MPYTFPDDIVEELFINTCKLKRDCSKGREGLVAADLYVLMKDGLVYKNNTRDDAWFKHGNHICHVDELTPVYTVDAGMAGHIRVMMLDEFMNAFPKYVSELDEKGKNHLYSPAYTNAFGDHYKEEWIAVDYTFIE